ncbi:MAG TPA: Spy/CpxP family protein refolding chaperone [Acetobacteraceae bacterium]|nr:Spy/CpxP family protein refolding chaperone [Acetobacteraceae bacterium]
MKASLLARTAPALLLTAILAGGGGAAAFAQTTPGTTPPAASSSPGAMPSGSATATHHATMTHHTRPGTRAPGETMRQMVDRRIAHLHARLHITAAEQQEWDRFARVMRDNAKELDQAYQQRGARFESMNAVENMQSYAEIEQTRSQGMQKLVPAFQTLYASLSDQQKQQADRLFRNYVAKAQQRHKKTAH